MQTELLILLAILIQVVVVTKAKVPAIIVFGDSSVDTGNNNVISTMLKSNFLPYGRDFEGGHPTGRFSNGRVPPDFISEAFKIKPSIPAYLDPAFSINDFATGVCFASAGTGYDNATASVLNVIPLWKEIEYYKEYQTKLRGYVGPKKANYIIREALYLISLGTNDFLENYYASSTRKSQFTISQFQDFLIGLARDFITTIYNIGARKMSLTGLPPMGCLPLERTTNFIGLHDCVLEYNNVALEFNGKLEALVSLLNKKLPGLKLVFTKNTYGTFNNIIKNPSSYGFDVAQVACCGTGALEMGYLCNFQSLTCVDASKYVFWDAFHPTERTNQILASQIIPTLLSEFK